MWIPRAVCSMFAFGRDKGPTQDHKDTLEHRIGKGYMCGESLDVPPYNLKEAHHCNDPVEPIYYATQDTRGLTKGREPLPIYRDCFDSEA
eukprot:scaffold2206_cov71-Attheya_sp.AAC.1